MQLTGDESFERDYALFQELLPKHRLHKHLRNVNRFNAEIYDGKILFELLCVTDEKTIKANRMKKSGTPSIAGSETKSPTQTDSKKKEDQRLNPGKDHAQENGSGQSPQSERSPKGPRIEYPGISWDDIGDEAIQTAHLVYNARTIAYRKMIEADRKLDDDPAIDNIRALVENDILNWMAFKELEHFENTGSSLEISDLYLTFFSSMKCFNFINLDFLRWGLGISVCPNPIPKYGITVYFKVQFTVIQ